MANKWGIPNDVEKLVLERDKSCVYCGTPFTKENSSRKTKASWEHIVNDIRIYGAENIALCCISCNASKGAKLLEDWLKSEYCRNRNISSLTVSSVVKCALQNPPSIKLK